MLLVSPRTSLKKSYNIYEAVRKYWKLKAKLLEKNTVPYVFAVVNGVIRGVFAVDKWLLSEIDGIRIYFEGREAENLKSYIGKRIPKKYCRPGVANPTLYIK